MELNKGDTILFQGDSITDAGRARPANNPANVVNGLGHLGPGYAGKVAGMLLADNPQLQLVVHNRGVSGNRVTDLRDRWSSDCLELKPDLVSILIGINDPKQPWGADVKKRLEEFHSEAGITEFIDAGDATEEKLAKISEFVSQSISSQSQALGTGGPSQSLAF